MNTTGESGCRRPDAVEWRMQIHLLNKRLLYCLCAAAVTLNTVCVIPFPIQTNPSTDKPGADLASAKPLTFDGNNQAVFTGTITSDSKVHVFDMGACAAGDRIIVAVDPMVGSPLDPVVAVFDPAGELFALNDDADPVSGELGSYVEDTVWTAGDHFYLAISRFYRDTNTGEYQATARIERGGTVAIPPVQYLLLDFDGGTIAIPGEGTIDVDPFDAANIDAAYAGKTMEIKAKIKEIVQQNYRNTGLQVLTTDDPPPAAGTFSTVYFGEYSTTKFGIAQGVDQGNKDRCDDGIVFTDDFDKPFAAQPTVEGVATAIANVASHEAGHLLGLNHVTDVTDLMDTTGSASTLLADQEFKTSPLHTSVFPFGDQNGPALLNRVVPQ